MRNCPRCQVPMSTDQRKFATIDRCPQCSGVYLDAGEGVTAMGLREDVASLAARGLARVVGHSAIACPAGHGAMTLFRFGEGESLVEIDICNTCQGAFFDAGEVEIIDELTSRAAGEGEGDVTTASGARFSAPPPTGGRASHESVVEAQRAEKGGSALSSFFTDLARATAEAARHGGRRRHGLFRNQHRHRFGD